MGGLAQRLIEPELLDILRTDDPRAVASRRDLVRINAIMFQAWIMAAELKRSAVTPPARILEIGCGDGRFMLAVAKKLSGVWRDVEIVLLDQADLVSQQRREGFKALGWRVTTVTADVFDWIERPDIGRFDLITTNLFLHHFKTDALSRLFAACRRVAPALVATEPHRNRLALGATGLLRAIGANDVTLHDAAASVRAGFAGNELARSWPASGDTMNERRVGPFTQVFSVRRAEAKAMP